MTHLLDTNICSAYLKKPGSLAHRFTQHGGLAAPTLVLGELFTWAFRRAQPDPILHLIDTDLLPKVLVIDFDLACARQYGRVRANMLSAGLVVSPVDLMIGVTALLHELTLVTHNVKHFEMIPGLRLEDWLTP